MNVKRYANPLSILLAVMVLVGLHGAPAAAEGPGAAVKTKVKKVDLNEATVQELAALPGIGAKKAEAIIEYRKSHKRFNSVEELKKVKGVGEKLFAKIEPMIQVSDKQISPSSPAK
ncbi:MAG: helix-hairpin-helix domain-containing protein [bacterium]|nr:helix-hairpin-helix domain-containing protein [bacterium]